MNDAQILEQLAATDAYAPATPMPIDAWTDDVTFAEIERRVRMQTQQTKPPVVPSSGRKRSRWLIAAAAFAVVLIIGAVIGLTVTRSNEVEPATSVPPTTQPRPTTTEAPSAAAAMEVASAFFEARDAWDGAAVIALMRPGATVAGDVAIVPGDYSRVADFDRALGAHIRIVACTESQPLPGAAPQTVRLTCTYELENDWSRALGVEVRRQVPFDSGNVYTFEITDGGITKVEASVTADFFTRVVNPFVAWLEDTHPDDVDLMFAVGPHAPWPGNRPLLNPDALALWERYSSEFVDFVTGSA